MTSKIINNRDENPLYSLRYMGHLKFIYWMQTVVAYLFAMSGCLIFIYSLIFGGVLAGAIYAGLFFVISLLILVTTKKIMKPMAYAKVHIYTDYFVLDRMGNLITVNYQDIEKIKINFIPYLGGGFVIHLKDKKNYRFTIVLVENYRLIEAIFAANPDVLDKSKKENFCQWARITDLGFKRLAQDFKSIKFISIRLVFLPLMAAIGLAMYKQVFLPSANELTNLSLSWYVSVFTKFFGVSIIVWSAFEIIHEIRDRKRQKSSSNINGELWRDIDNEKQLYFVELLAVVMIMVLLIIFGIM